jgi:hypothetical protein
LAGLKIMMGHRQVEQAALFYEFSLEKHIPADHLLRSIDRFVDLDQVRRDLAPFYSSIGRPSIDPELMIRMLLIGYCFGIRSERRLCDEVHLNLATGGSAGSDWTGWCQITRPFPKTGMVASGRATSSVACSRASCVAASRSDWSVVKGSQSMQV